MKAPALVLVVTFVLCSVNALGEPAAPAAPAAPPAPPAPATAPAGAAPTPPAAAAPKRAKVTCAAYRASVEKSAKHAVFDTRLKAGSWGRVPPELRKLPRKSKLCGADKMGQAVIASPLFGGALESFYTPLFVKIGFKPLECKVEQGRTECRTKRHRDIGILVTDQDSEVLVMSVINR